MLEVWADLLAFTGDQRAADLVDRYDRPRFFEPLLAGVDVLTNKHANTQIAEILGAARAWEVTGVQRWRDIVEAFWDAAVETRGTYCTSGSSCGEVWQPPGEQSARLHAVQEHCLVYNLMRLAAVMFRWTGDHRYADYWERNLVNGIWAQQHPDTGMPAYFLPLAAGSRKQWGRPTEDFWCCHGTLLQAHASIDEAALYVDGTGISISQYLNSVTTWPDLFGGSVQLTIAADPEEGVALGQRQTFHGAAGIQELLSRPLPPRRPNHRVYVVDVHCDRPSTFELRLRVPAWSAGAPMLEIDGKLGAGGCGQRLDRRLTGLEQPADPADRAVRAEYSAAGRSTRHGRGARRPSGPCRSDEPRVRPVRRTGRAGEFPHTRPGTTPQLVADGDVPNHRSAHRYPIHPTRRDPRRAVHRLLSPTGPKSH